MGTKQKINVYKGEIVRPHIISLKGTTRRPFIIGKKGVRKGS
jgi:hypothetical protein